MLAPKMSTGAILQEVEGGEEADFGSARLPDSTGLRLSLQTFGLLLRILRMGLVSPGMSSFNFWIFIFQKL